MQEQMKIVLRGTEVGCDYSVLNTLYIETNNEIGVCIYEQCNNQEWPVLARSANVRLSGFNSFFSYLKTVLHGHLRASGSIVFYTGSQSFTVKKSYSIQVH